MTKKENDLNFPTIEEARKILDAHNIDTSELKENVTAMICERVGHKWELSWPLHPCEWTCARCKVKSLHS